MKRWLARTCWIAAWGAWCWAGYGLWRELPRSLGREIGRLEFASGERMLGLMADKRRLVTKIEDSLSPAPGATVRVWDLKERLLVREFRVPDALCACAHDRLIVLGHRGFDFNRLGRGEFQDEAIFDLNTGATIRTKTRDWASGVWIDFHNERPWAVASGILPGDSRNGEGHRLLVVNLVDGAIVGALPKLQSGEDLSGFAFKPGSELLFVIVKNRADGRLRGEIWNLPPEERPIRSFPLPDSAYEIRGLVVSASGRCAWYDDSDGDFRLHVIDLSDGRTVFTDPPVPRRESEGNGPAAEREEEPSLRPVRRTRLVASYRSTKLSLSADGKMLFDQAREFVVDVYTGRVAWAAPDALARRSPVPAAKLLNGEPITLNDVRAFPEPNPRQIRVKPGQRASKWEPPKADFADPPRVESSESASAHSITRRWNEWVGAWAQKWRIEYSGRAVRDLQTGALEFRCDVSTIGGECADGVAFQSAGVFVDHKGRILALGPAPRWELIALMEVILAIPLVGLWGLLRWRESRMATAAAA